MELNNLIKITTKQKKRGGQGYGSGRGKTAGRGLEGQKKRTGNRIPLWFEGGRRSLIKRLPYLRGKGKNKTFKKKPVGINLSELNIFKKGSVVDVKALIESKIIEERYVGNGVKILGNGKIDNSLTIKLLVTKGAKNKIEKVGGKIIQ